MSEPEPNARETSGLETKLTYIGLMIATTICCLPFGLIYYLDNRERVAVCPACRESVKLEAAICKHCREDLDKYR